MNGRDMVGVEDIVLFDHAADDVDGDHCAAMYSMEDDLKAYQDCYCWDNATMMMMEGSNSGPMQIVMIDYSSFDDDNAASSPDHDNNGQTAIKCWQLC